MQQASLIDNEKKRYIITLPWPPTVNSYWDHFSYKGSTKINVKTSEKGLSYQKQVWAICQRHRYCTLGNKELLGRKLKVTIFAFPPDAKRRDLDNLNKALLDALQTAGMYKDDYDIDDLRSIRKEIVKGGKVKVVVETI